MFRSVLEVLQLLVLCLSLAGAELVVKNAERTIDLTSQLIKVNAVLTVENTGSKPQASVLIASDPGSKGTLAFITAKAGDETLDISPAPQSNHPSVKHVSVALPKPLDKGQTSKLEIEKVYIHGLEPFPAEITQSQKQLVRFLGNHYIFSPYAVRQQTTKVQLASSTVETYTKLKPSQLTDSTITLGPYENIQPYSRSELLIHFENNSPFLVATRLERDIQVSHWGTISVEERVQVRHVGARLRGAFSRFDFQREHNSGVSSVQQFKTSLPAAASGVYYRDEIGNISTSRMRVQPDEVELELRPRFPLFGGWKTYYVIGYTVPVYEYLYRKGDDYVLSMRLLDHVFDNMVVEDLTVSIILPEGSTNIELKTPYPVERKLDSVLLTYLDVTGRPVITVTKQNLVEAHIQDFQLGYTFPPWMLVREPLMIVTAFLLLFLLVIIYVRLDFSITTEDGALIREKVASLCDKVRGHHDTRCTLYQSMEDSIGKVKANKDTSAFQTAVKSASASLKTETSAIGSLQEQLRAEGGADAAEKVAELQRLDKTLRDLLTQHVTATERLVSGKLNKSQYVDQESQINKKKEETVQRMEVVLASI